MEILRTQKTYPKNEKAFLREIADKWYVIAEYESGSLNVPDGMVAVRAIFGKPFREPGMKSIFVLIPEPEYDDRGKFGFWFDVNHTYTVVHKSPHMK